MVQANRQSLKSYKKNLAASGAFEGSVFYTRGGGIPLQRDWNRRASGPQLNREPVGHHNFNLSLPQET